MLNDDVLDYMQRSVLCWVATVGPDGVPNVSPKEVFAAHGRDEVLVAHIASPKTVLNISSNHNVCISFVDVFAQKGYKLLGSASIVVPGDARFQTLLAPLALMTGDAFPIHGVISIKVTAVEHILAPSYRLRPETTEASQVESAMRTYGVSGRSRNPG